jgi:tetratricopeptide (TPR) repeat protein
MNNLQRILLTVAVIAATLPASAQRREFERLRTLGDSCFRAKNFVEALTYYKRAEPIAVKQYDNVQGRFFARMGHCQKAVGDYDGAIQSYERIGRLRFFGPDNEAVVVNLSTMYILTGRADKALAVLQPLKCTTDATIGSRITNMALAYETLAANAVAAEAQKYRERAVAMLDSLLADHPDATDIYHKTALNNRGYLLWEMGRNDEAYTALSEAVKLLSNDVAKYRQALGNLALVEAETGHGDDALSHIEACIKWFADNYGTTHPDYISALRKKAEILHKLGRTKEAVVAFKEFFEQARLDVVSRFAYMSVQERQDYWSMMRPLIAECYLVGQADPAFAFDVAVFAKSVMVQASRDFLTARNTDAESQQTFRTLQSLRMQAANSTGSERMAYEQQAEQLEKQLMQQSNVYRQYRQTLAVTGDDIRRALTTGKDVAVEFVRYSNGSEPYYAACICTKQGNISFVPLFSQQEIESYGMKGKARLFGTLSENLTSATGGKKLEDDKNVLYDDPALAQKIWNPIIAHVPSGANIFFAPEGIFNILGIEYLDFGRKGYHFYRLSATRSLLEQTDKNWLEKTLIVGGVEYSDASESLRVDEPLPDRSASRLFFQEVVRDGAHPFVYLEGSKREIEHIAKMLTNRDVTVDSVTHVPEERLKAEMEYYTTVHISTHGYAYHIGNAKPRLAADSITEDLSLVRSLIALSGVNEAAQRDTSNINLEDGLLTAREISALDLSRVRLVVLSACQTGLGRTVDDGLVGLPLGLKRAGVGCVVVSLWPVSDAATEQLMVFLYDNLSGGKFHSVTDALNDARQRLRKAEGGKFDKPYYYNAFIAFDGQ